MSAGEGEWRYKGKEADGTVKDAIRLDYGYWEAKDQYDDLDKEIEIDESQRVTEIFESKSFKSKASKFAWASPPLPV